MSDAALSNANNSDSLSPSEYLAERVEDQISWYDRKSVWNQRWFKRLRVIEIVSAAMIPFLTALPDAMNMKYVIGATGVIITIVAAALALHQFQERWIEYRATCESLKKERFLYLTKTEPYNGENVFSIFVQRIETLTSKENTGWAQSLIKPNSENQQTS